MRKSPWRVKIEDLPDAGTRLEVDARDSILLGLLQEVAEGSAAAVAGFATLEVESWPSRIDIKGELSARVPMQCARCLDGYVQELAREFTQILARSPSGDSEEEIELATTDLDRSELEGDTLDLEEILREELLLSVPSKPLCREDCKGICPGCGAELNTVACTCPPEIDDRWAALTELKRRLGQR